MDTAKERTWTTGRILAVVIPVCVAVIATVVTLALVLGDGGGKEEASGDTAGAGEMTDAEEEMIETYEEIKQDADAAVAEMEDLESQEAASDPDAYEQELEEALTAYDQLLADLDEAANAAIEVSEDYEELYAYINDYYEYLYGLTEQAVSEMENLLALVPTMQELEQAEGPVERLENLPAAITQAQQQLASSIKSLVSGYASALAQIEANVEAAMP
ncbi:MAG: hypothetical protein AB1384_10075 [Actinomycetota bacterium]